VRTIRPTKLEFCGRVSKLAAMSSGAFCYSHRVTYAECTLGDHVYHSRYLDILEAARGEFFRQRGTSFLDWQGWGIIFPIIECRLTYKSMARYDDLLDIQVELLQARGVRTQFGYRINKQPGKLVLEAETWHACTDLENRPRRIPEALLALVKDQVSEV